MSVLSSVAVVVVVVALVAPLVVARVVAAVDNREEEVPEDITEDELSTWEATSKKRRTADEVRREKQWLPLRAMLRLLAVSLHLFSPPFPSSLFPSSLFPSSSFSHSFTIHRRRSFIYISNSSCLF
jgi:hypothetical protein